MSYSVTVIFLIYFSYQSYGDRGAIPQETHSFEKLNKETHNDQLLMLLHGSPGTGKSFIINRLQDPTTIDLRITATSGIAAMSLRGITID